MAWTEQCKIAFDVAAKRYVHKGMKVKDALKQLSEESDVPFKTLRNWYYKKSPENGTPKESYGKNSEINIEVVPDGVRICATCNNNPARPEGTDCYSCKGRKEREGKIKRLHQIAGHIRALQKQLEKDSQYAKKWSNGITRNEYEKVMGDVFLLIETWEKANAKSQN